MYAIQAAYEGRMEMLKAIFGDGKAAPEGHAESARPMTPQLFDALFK